MKGFNITICVLLIALGCADIVNSPDQTLGYSSRLSSIATIVYVPEQGKREPNDIYKFVDNALKNKYWFYLANAKLLYAAAVQKGDTYQFLAIYRNIVGTFLAITSWKNQSDVFNVNTLVRLGNGDAKQLGANYDPVNVNLQYFRFALGKDEFLIYSADGSQNDLNGNIKDLLLVKECKVFSDSIRKNFWYFVSEANVVYSSVAQTAAKNYCMIIYVNIVGTFFVIGDEERATSLCKANTLVRIGQGAAPLSAQDSKPLNEQNTVLKLQPINA